MSLWIGALSDLQGEWLQRYFDHLSRGTVAEGARLDVDRVPAVFRSKGCPQSFEVMSLIDDGFACEHCQSGNVILASARQHMVKRVEVV